MSEPTVSQRPYSRPAAEVNALQTAIQSDHNLLDSIPSLPAIVQSLLGEVSQDPEKVDLNRVADLISRDESITAQCLRLANSPLLARGVKTDSIRGVVHSLGIARVREIAVSSMMMRLSRSRAELDPIVFWEHSLGTAIVSRKLARAVGYSDPEKAYLAGLLHDLGYLVNFVLFPKQEAEAVKKALESGEFLGDSEYDTLGFTHCQSGEILSRHWHFSPELTEVVLCHHDAKAAVVDPALVAIVALADRVCRSTSLGVGYKEADDPSSAWQTEWDILRQNTSYAAEMRWSDFVKEAGGYIADVREMVKAMYQSG